MSEKMGPQELWHRRASSNLEIQIPGVAAAGHPIRDFLAFSGFVQCHILNTVAEENQS
jgi:hypothetical protein